MISKVALTTLCFVFAVYAQQVGTQVAEIHPRLSWEKCTSGTCQRQTQGAIVLDANFRPSHSTSGAASCYTGNTWNATLCPDGTTCAMNCALEGVDYCGSFGITSGGNSVALKLVTISEGLRNVGSRVYLLADDSHYEIFHLLNQEFTFDVDVSQLPCGLNGALYFSQMDANGGYRFPTNTAGPKYGTGYCDAQCPRNLRFVNGVVRLCLCNLTECHAHLCCISRRTRRAGLPPAARAIWARAVVKWTSGRQIRSRQLTPLIRANHPSKPLAMAPPVVAPPINMVHHVTLTAATSTHSAWAILHSMART